MLQKGGLMLPKHGEYAQLEKAFPFIEHLSLGNQEKLLDNINSVHYEAGKVLLEDGLNCANAFFVLSGSIRVFKMSQDGKEVTLYRIRGGETCLMTVSCIMTNSEFQGVALVEEPTELIIVPGVVFKDLLSGSPEFLKFVFAKTLLRLREVMLVVENVTFDSMRKRVALFLHDSLMLGKGSLLKITHEQIAFEIGSAREVVSRTLKDLATDGIVKLSRGTIEVLDKEQLKNILVT